MIGELTKYDITPERAARISDEILETIERFSVNMAAIEKFCAAGGTKEKWLRNFIDENVPAGQKAEYLSQVNAALTAGNQIADKVDAIRPMPEVFADIHKIITEPVEVPAAAGISDLKEQISQQTKLITANTLANPVVISEEIAPIEGLDTLSNDDMTMVSSLAMKISAVTDKIPFIDILPVSALTNLVRLGGETVNNMIDLARGKIKSPAEALEKTGRATVAAVADFIKSGFPATIFMTIPVLGPKLTFVAGAYLRSLSREKIQETIYAGVEKVKTTAKAAAGKIKKAVKSVKTVLVAAWEKVTDFLWF